MAVLSPHNSFNLSMPPPAVKPSISARKEESIMNRLNEAPLPDKEINDILNLHDSLNIQEVSEGFDIATTKMIRWLETAQLAVYTMEQHVKEEAQDIQEMHSILDLAVGKMEPLIAHLEDIGEIMQDKYEDSNDGDGTKNLKARMTIAKIQSEWSGLQHYFISVKRQVDSINERKQLLVLMENVLQQVDDVSTLIFQYQEQKHCPTVQSSVSGDGVYVESPSSSIHTPTSQFFTPSSVSGTAPSTKTGDTSQNSSSILVDINNMAEPLFNDVQRVYASMTSDKVPHDPTGILSRKHALVQERWDSLRAEIDDLKDELKEDRWLTVFRQVANQVDTMMEALEKAVGQCYTVIVPIRDWYAAQHAATPPTPPVTGNAFDRISKTILRSFPRSHHSSSSNSSSSSALPPPPVDREKLRAVEKNFEGKHKLYALSVDKMLAMLGSGIVSRVSQNSDTINRHKAMVNRWAELKQSMDNLWNNDLPEADRILALSERSPSAWKNIRYKTPEPKSASATQAKSQSRPNTLPKSLPNSNRYSSNLERRVRSVTPNGGDPYGSTNNQHLGRNQKRATSSMAYSRDGHLTVNKPLRPSTSDSSPAEPPRHTLSNGRSAPNRTGTRGSNNGSPWSPEMKPGGVNTSQRKSRVPSSTIESVKEEVVSWMKPTKSTALRSRLTQNAESESQNKTDSRPKTAPVRSKTPTADYSSRKSTTPRSKSSLGQHGSPQQPHVDRDRMVSPVKRTMTPSLIPRPKTPSDGNSHARALSPSLIPRPRSAMHHSIASSPPPMPPLPPLASNTPSPQVVPSNESSDDSYSLTSYTLSGRTKSPPPQTSTKRQLQKKQSMPALMHRVTSPFRQSRVPGMPIPSPPPRQTQYPYEDDDSSTDGERASRRSSIQTVGQVTYVPNPKDPLDVQVAKILNASPVPVRCQRAPQGGGKYYFGNELNPALGGGRRLYTCKLMNYTDRRGAGNGKATHSKVLVRVGGGWEELQMFLLEHASLFV